MKITSSALLLSLAFLASSPSFSQEEEITISEPPAGKTKNNLEPAGQIVWVSGTVKATYPEQTPRILSRGAVIYEKDTIITDDKGSGQISFTDNSMLTLTPQSKLVVEQYYFNQQKPLQGGQTVLNLLKGGFRTITGFVAKGSPSNYQVKTPVATIGVRGTDFQGICSGNPSRCAIALLHGEGLTLVNDTGTYNLTPQSPYAEIAGYTTHAVISKSPSSMLGITPVITPANAPPPGKSGGGNCGILIN